MITTHHVQIDEYPAEFLERSVSPDAFLRLPGNERLEWTDGQVHPDDELAENPTDHAFLQNRLATRLTAYVERHGLGVVPDESANFLVTRSDGRQALRRPDISFIATDDATAIRRQSPLEVPPDLAVEVLSDYDRYASVMGRVRLWLNNGAKLVWVVDREGMVFVYRPDGADRGRHGDDMLDGEDVVPGFALRVGDLYA